MSPSLVSVGARAEVLTHRLYRQAEKLAVISLHSVLSLLMKVQSLCVPVVASADNRTLQGEFRQGHSAEGKVKTSRVVQHIGEAVQAQARPLRSDPGAFH